jgi:hypothetical protein
MSRASTLEWKLGDQRFPQEKDVQRQQLEQVGTLERTDIFFNVSEFQSLYGGLGTTFARSNGKITRALIPLKAHPRAPEELWVAAEQEFTVGDNFPMFVWRSYDRWEYDLSSLIFRL